MKKRVIAFLMLATMFFTMFPIEVMAVLTDGGGTAVSMAQENKKPDNPFTDVKENDWYYDAVQYSRFNGFFGGISDYAFDPDGTMSRGMFVTVLGRMAGIDTDEYKGKSAFSDVPDDAYYAPFVAWASAYGITSGTGNGEFDPDGMITREQMAVFFVRYFETFDVDFDTGSDITSIPADIDEVSPWARDAVLKMWRTGLLGRRCKLQPCFQREPFAGRYSMHACRQSG